VPKLDPVIVIIAPKLGIDRGKILRISGGGYENAEKIKPARSKMVTDTLRAFPEPWEIKQSN
jgi:hypothetical protein